MPIAFAFKHDVTQPFLKETHVVQMWNILIELAADMNGLL